MVTVTRIAWPSAAAVTLTSVVVGVRHVVAQQHQFNLEEVNQSDKRLRHSPCQREKGRKTKKVAFTARTASPVRRTSASPGSCSRRRGS